MRQPFLYYKEIKIEFILPAIDIDYALIYT